MATDERPKCPVCEAPGCRAPREDEIPWDVTPDSLFETCTTPKAWALLLPELQRLQREYEAGPALTAAEQQRNRRRASALRLVPKS